MAALGDGALQAGVEDVAGEEGQDVRLAGEPRGRVVVVDDRLEARHAADGLCRALSGGLSATALGEEQGQDGRRAYSTW